MVRSYHPESTGSHQIPEVKLGWAGLVLDSGMIWESPVTNCFSALYIGGTLLFTYINTFHVFRFTYINTPILRATEYLIQQVQCY